MKTKLSTFSLSLYSLFFAAGCGMLNDMHDATMQMNKTTSEMNDGMKQTNVGIKESNAGIKESNLGIRESIDGIKESNSQIRDTNATASNTYTDLRQGNSLTIRSQRMDSMAAASAPEAKVAEAAAYFEAFEFQLYKNEGHDNAKSLAILELQAMQEFFREIRKFGVSSHDIKPTSTDSNILNLEALAVTMHQINPTAERVAAENGLPKISMLSLIEDTIARKPQIEASGASAPYESEILLNEEDAAYMLQLRANFFGAMVLERLTHISEEGLIDKTKKMMGSYDVSLAKPNIAQLQNYADWLSEALRVRAELKSFGYDPKIEGTLLRLFANMNLIRTSKDDHTTKAHQGAEKTLADLIDKYRAH